MIIGGKNVTASESFVHTSPIDTRIILAYFPSGTAKHVQHAIKAGMKAFESWGKTDYKERVEFFRIAINIMNRRKFELAAWLSYGNGKNRYEAISDVDEAIDFIRYYSKQMENNNGFIAQTKSLHPNEKTRV